METIVINGVNYVKENSCKTMDLSTSEATFLQIGEKYLIRTVTMIYTGKLKAMSKHELLLECCCWIPETERWHQCVSESIFKEVEPYKNDVIVFKGAILDITIINKLPTDQK